VEHHAKFGAAHVRAVVVVLLVGACAAGAYELATARVVVHVPAIFAIFQSMVWEGVPFILIGAVVATLVEMRLRPENLALLLPDSLGGHTTAAFIGLLLPVCDCGTIPVARTLMRKSVPDAVAFTYALAAPTVNLIALLATFAAFHGNMEWVLWRGGAAVVIAVLAGYSSRLGKDHHTEAWVADRHAAAPAATGFAHAVEHMTGEVFAVGPIFVASALVAAAAHGVFTPAAAVAFAQHSVWGIVFLMGVGSTLSLCSSADAFVAAGLLGVFSPGAILAFLLCGQMIDLRNLFLFPHVFGKRTLAAGLFAASALIFVAALVANHAMTGVWV
jgi:uncharacterized membrane protein YraQ (UPF0718 family)